MIHLLMCIGALYIVEYWIKIVAFFAAAAFFIYKVITGSFFVNLSLRVSTERSAKIGSDDDQLAVSMELAKGERGSILLNEIQVRVKHPEVQPPIRVHGTFRAMREMDQYQKEIINFDKPDVDFQWYRIPPGETAVFTCLIPSIPRNHPCIVEVIVIAEREYIITKRTTKKWGRSQWRSSAISLPSLHQDHN
jgi:hypothetical protein